MAFTATIKAITLDGDRVRIDVQFADSASGFSTSQSFFELADGTVTQQQAVNKITAVGQTYKNNISAVTALQPKVGTVITI